MRHASLYILVLLSVVLMATPVAKADAVQLVFLIQPTFAAPTVPIFPAVQVALEDSAGNITTSLGEDSISLTLTSGVGPAGGTLIGGGSTATTNGIATFSNLALDNAGTYQLTAVSNVLLLGSVNSTTFEIGLPNTSGVPEPGTGGLMLLGIGFVLAIRKRIAQGLPKAT
jgi:hypothetical protein